MNDKAFDTSLAMSDMDDALVSEAANADALKRRPAPWIAAAAAALALIIGSAIAIPKLTKPKENDISALTPTEAPAAEVHADLPEATEAPATEAPTPVPTAEAPRATFDPMMLTCNNRAFGSVTALNMAVRTSLNNEIGGELSDPDDPIYDLREIYMPVSVPYGAEFGNISVTSSAVVVTYYISDEWRHFEDWELESMGYTAERFALIWYRNWQPGTLDTFAESLYEQRGFHDYEPEYFDGIYAFHTSGCFERIALWEQDGLGFEMILPGYYTDEADVLEYMKLVKVSLGDVDVYDPAQGFDVQGYLWLMQQDGVGCEPHTALAYSRTYGDGAMVEVQGPEFLSLITDDMRSYEGIMKAFPHIGRLFEPMLAEDTEIVRIDVYGSLTLDLIAEDISLEELYAIARFEVSEELIDYITGDNRGNLLVDIVIEHRGAYIEELGEYEVEAYHCAFLMS